MPLPTKQPWQQEVVWIQRNSDNVIIGVSEAPPADDNFIPQAPRPVKSKEVSR